MIKKYILYKEFVLDLYFSSNININLSLQSCKISHLILNFKVVFFNCKNLKSVPKIYDKKQILLMSFKIITFSNAYLIWDTRFCADSSFILIYLIKVQLKSQFDNNSIDCFNECKCSCFCLYFSWFLLIQSGSDDMKVNTVTIIICSIHVITNTTA